MFGEWPDSSGSHQWPFGLACCRPAILAEWRGGEMKNARPQTTEASALDKRNFTVVSEKLNARLLDGHEVRAIDFMPEQRAAFWAALAILRDELPIVERWKTLGERHMAGTRLRVKVFYIPQDVRKSMAGGSSHD